MDVPQTADVGTPDFVVALPGGRTLYARATKPGLANPSVTQEDCWPERDDNLPQSWSAR